eukprot:3466322-Prymnesium_polylepis.4
MYASLWIGYWQALWGLLLFPVNWVPLPNTFQYFTPSNTWEVVTRGLTCFVGEVPHDDNGTLFDPSDQSCASPGGSAAT